MIHYSPDFIYRYFNDYLRGRGVRTSDIDINTAIYEALGEAGFTGHITERAQQAVEAGSFISGTFYQNITQIVSASLLDPLPSFLGSKLLAWYDPTDIDTLFQDSTATTPVTTDNDPVGYLGDKSGNGRHFIQITADSRPLYQDTGTLLYDGIADCLLLSPSPFPSGASPCDIFMEVSQNTLPADTENKVPFSYGGNTAALSRRLQRFVSSGVNRYRVQTGDGSNPQSVEDTNIDFSSNHLIRASFRATEHLIDIDGYRTRSSMIPATTTSRARIGAANGSSAASFWNGNIGRIVISTELTPAEVHVIRNYLSS